MQNSKDKSVYVCDHAELSSTALAATYQPDWIVDAMGLRPISPDEATRIKVRPGPEPATTALILPTIGTGAQAYSRVMIVSNLTRKVQEYRVISPDGKILIAQAAIKKYQDLPTSKTGRATSGGSESCSVPENIVLDWKKEQLTLDVTLKRSGDQPVRPRSPECLVRRALAARLRTGRPGRTGPSATERRLNRRPGDDARSRATQWRAIETARGDPQRRRGGESIASNRAAAAEEPGSLAGLQP